MALDNYIEMRAGVVDPDYVARRALALELEPLEPAQAADRLGQRGDAVAREVEPLEPRQAGAELERHARQLVALEVELDAAVALERQVHDLTDELEATRAMLAEQHAVTLAAGMACDGVKPVVAIYSTFLQRGYDQLIHDVALQNLDVTFAIDRAGLVGQDGATHHGAFDLSYLRCIPNLIIAAPSNENDCRQMLVSAYNHTGPSAVRYPRGEGTGVRIEPQLRGVEIGKGHVVREGSEIAILNFGVLLTEAEKAGEALNATVADMRWVKPLDTDLIMQLAQTHSRFITIEENVVAGGAGSGVAEYLASQGLSIEIRHVAIDDRFIDHASQGETRIDAGLSCDHILEQANLGHAKPNGTKTAVAL